MKIETNNKITFGNIKKGEVFTYQGFYYLKIDRCNDVINSVNLETGSLGHFASSMEVELCPNAILKIN